MDKINFPKATDVQNLLLKNKGTVVFLVSFIIAFVIWLLFAFNDAYTTNIKLEINYKNKPIDRVLTNHPLEFCELRIEASGWDILKIRRKSKSFPLEVDLSSVPENGKINTASLASNRAFRKFTDLKVLGVNPDYISFEFESLKTKKVKVKPITHLEYARQYGPSGIVQITPDVVEISGPESIIDTLSFIETDDIIEKNVSSNLNRIVKLHLPEVTGLSCTHDQVLLNIEVDRFTELSFDIPVKIPGNGSDSISIIPTTVSLSFQIAISNIDKVNPADFYIWADLSTLNRSSYKKLQVKAQHTNKYIRYLTLKPEFVDYVIRRTND